MNLGAGTVSLSPTISALCSESARTVEHPEGKVEFYFTLPVAAGYPCKSSATLPRHSVAIAGALLLLAPPSDANEPNIDHGELSLEAEVGQAVDDLGCPLRILVVDDEAIYRNALVSYLSRTPELAQALAVVRTSNAEEALQAAMNERFDLVITDVDMGRGKLDALSWCASCARGRRRH